MHERVAEVFNDSFELCMAEEEFLDRFYERFLSVSEEVASKFANTDFEQQKRALKRSLYVLLVFSSDNGAVAEKMQSLAERHSRKDQDISPRLYAAWIDCLVETARSFDRSFSEETEAAWRTTFEPGIAYLKARY